MGSWKCIMKEICNGETSKMRLSTSICVLLVTLILAIISAAFGYGSLTNAVNQNAQDIGELKVEYKTIIEKLNNIDKSISSIETEIKLNREDYQ